MTESTRAFPVDIRERPERRVAYMRHIGPYQNVGPTFMRFMQWAGPKGLFGPTTEVLGIGHDDPATTAADKIRYDCCITVPADFQPEGDIGVQTLPAGSYAVLTLRGPYSELPAAYKYLFADWLPASGRACGGFPPFEIYRNSPADTKPEDLITEVCALLTPR